jgi:hypothetical protein
LHDGASNAGATRLTADRAWPLFEFAEREPKTDRIDDETKNESKRNHFTSSYVNSLILRVKRIGMLL